MHPPLVQPRPAIAEAVEHGLRPAHADILFQVGAAIECGDVSMLRTVLFEPDPWRDGERVRWVMKPGVARALLEGFDRADLGAAVSVGSFAELCFVYGRAAMMRDVLECVRPAEVDLRSTADDAHWFDFLCTRYSDGQYARVSLLHAATFEVTPHSRDFIVLALEFRPDEDKVRQIAFTNPRGAALITECEMAMRVRQAHGGRVNQAPAVADQEPAVRRARTRSL